MLYRYSEIVSLVGFFTLQDDPHVDITFTGLQMVIGFIIGFSPILFNAIRDRTKWKIEKNVVQSEAVENIANAASILAESSQDLAEKSAVLIILYENALERQVKMTEKEREKRRTQEIDYSTEIAKLKTQIAEINETVLVCSREILSLITDINEGTEITPERLCTLENHWKA